MRRYDTILNSDGALVIGAGLAGLFCALKLTPRPVTILSPKPLGTGASSAWAQGGVAAAIGAQDSPKIHAHDTSDVGGGIVDEQLALSIAQEAMERIHDLTKLGTPFDIDKDGFYELSREAAHTHNRVVRVCGDRAGRAIMDSLIKVVRNTANIRIVEGVSAVDLAVEDGKVAGAFARKLGDRYGSPLFFAAQATILAAGGLGGLYDITTNPTGVRGHALGMAARAGAEIADPEFVQFHPTALDVGEDPAPLATEALRGEGAVLINDLGTRFMLDVHEDAELAPRDIVARAAFRQVAKGRRVFLDTREALGDKITQKFPTVASYCAKFNIDPVNQPIPVRPAAHFHMGGVAVNDKGRSSLPNLWVCGEASSTGFHGANRLASNSLLEAIVFGARAAQDIADQNIECLAPTKAPLFDFDRSDRDADMGEAAEATLQQLHVVKKLRQTMSQLVGVEREAEGLKQALNTLADLERNAKGVSRSFLNMTTAGSFVAAAALMREESRGGHFRTDFPKPNPNWAHNTKMNIDKMLDIRRQHSA